MKSIILFTFFSLQISHGFSGIVPSSISGKERKGAEQILLKMFPHLVFYLDITVEDLPFQESFLRSALRRILEDESTYRGTPQFHKLSDMRDSLSVAIGSDAFKLKAKLGRVFRKKEKCPEQEQVHSTSVFSPSHPLFHFIRDLISDSLKSGYNEVYEANYELVGDDTLLSDWFKLLRHFSHYPRRLQFKLASAILLHLEMKSFNFMFEYMKSLPEVQKLPLSPIFNPSDKVDHPKAYDSLKFQLKKDLNRLISFRPESMNEQIHRIPRDDTEHFWEQLGTKLGLNQAQMIVLSTLLSQNSANFLSDFFQKKLNFDLRGKSLSLYTYHGLNLNYIFQSEAQGHVFNTETGMITIKGNVFTHCDLSMEKRAPFHFELSFDLKSLKDVAIGPGDFDILHRYQADLKIIEKASPVEDTCPL